MESTLGKSVCVPGNADSPGADDDSGLLENACTNPAAFADLYNPAASDIGVLDTVVHAEEQQRFPQALATLSVEQRELLALKAAGELSAREIGALTEVRGPWRLPVPLPSIAQP